MRNQGRRDSTAYRRAQTNAALRACKTLIQKRDICGAACRARSGLWRARPMKHCEYDQMASGGHFPHLTLIYG